ncbi:MAG: hypothetical protein K6T75_05385 [Acetobacteraceae bacterium]|nr:hypothetical protein [Acetobacteraceae bacterium]
MNTNYGFGEFASVADLVAKECLRLKPREELLLVTDSRASRKLVDAVGFAARAAGAIVQEISYDYTGWGVEPPRCVAAAMAAADVVFSLSQLCHERAVHQARRAGTRVMCALVSEDTFLRLVPVDYPKMRATAQSLGRIFARGRKCRVTCPLGTDLTLELCDRLPVIVTGTCHEPGTWEFLPPGTVAVAPREGSARGTVVISGSADPLGLLDGPIQGRFEGGYLRSADAIRQGARDASRWWEALSAPRDPNMFNLAEFGIGINPRARLGGDLGEDERIAGQVHLGLGNSLALGGEVEASGHYDAMVLNPTVTVDGATVVDGGRLVGLEL